MVNKNLQAASNLAMLELMARRLGRLKDEVVFLGGCTTALFITDPATPDVRTTLDVDCIVDVISLSQYYKLAEKLQKQGFKKSMDDNIICRWHYDEMILDVMPTDKKILGFGNSWYKAAIEYAITHELSKGLFIKSVTAPYFLATKFEAFKARGNNDFLASHDFEDIIAVIDGRLELADEIATSDMVLRKHLAKTFAHILQEQREQLHSALPGHLIYGELTNDRVQVIWKRIEQIAQLNK